MRSSNKRCRARTRRRLFCAALPDSNRSSYITLCHHNNTDTRWLRAGHNQQSTHMGHASRHTHTHLQTVDGALLGQQTFGVLDEPVRRKLARRRQVRRVTVARAGVDAQNGVGLRVVGDDPAVGRRDVPHKLGGKTASAIAHKAHRVFGFFGHLMLARAWHGSAAIIKS